MKIDNSAVLNKIVMSVVVIMIFLGIICMTNSYTNNGLIFQIVKFAIHIYSLIPVALFLTYLLLIPLSYRSKGQESLKTLTPYDELKINQNFIDRFFDSGAEWTTISFFTIATTLGVFYFAFGGGFIHSSNIEGSAILIAGCTVISFIIAYSLTRWIKSAAR